jgi:hypothetical protein
MVQVTGVLGHEGSEVSEIANQLAKKRSDISYLQHLKCPVISQIELISEQSVSGRK